MNDSRGPMIFELFKEIGIINQLSTVRFTKALAPDLNPSEFSVLNHFVMRGDGKTPSYLAKAFQMTKPSMTAIVGKLAAKGYVEIAAGEKDRRQKFVTITEAGRAVRGRGLEAVGPLAGEVMAGFDVSKLAEILPILQQLREFLDEARNVEDGLT
ncbi:MAG: MarR family transcriptional regulator [Henriciella sp.]